MMRFASFLSPVPQQRSLLARYGVAVVLTFAALLLTSLFWTTLNATSEASISATLLFFVFAVILSAIYGGLGPGITCGILSALLTDYFFIMPYHQIAFNSLTGDTIRLTLFLIVAFAISYIEERRRVSEVANQQKTAELSAILSAIRDGLSLQDKNGVITYINPALAAFNFAPSAEWLMKQPPEIQWGNIVADSAIDENEMALDPSSIFSQVFSTAQSTNWSVKLADPKSEAQRILSVITVPIFDIDRQVRMVAHVARDITARSVYEEELKRLNAQLEEKAANLQIALAVGQEKTAELDAILNAMRDGVSMQRADGELLYANPAMASFVQFDDLEQMTRVPISEQWARLEILEMSDDQGLPIDATSIYECVFTHGQAQTWTMHYRVQGSAEEHWLSLITAPIFHEGGHLVRSTITVARDIGMEKQQEKARRELASRLEKQAAELEIAFKERAEKAAEFDAILNAMQDGVTIQRADGEVTYANPASANVIQSPHTDMTGSVPVSELWARLEVLETTDDTGSPIDAQRVYAHVFEHRQSKVWSLRYRLHGSDDEYWLSNITTPIFDNGSNIVRGTVVVSRDITEQKRSEVELKRLNDRIAAQSEEVNIILEAITDSVTAQLENGQAVYANSAAAGMSGFSAVEEMLTIPFPKSRESVDIYDERGEIMPLSAMPRVGVFQHALSSDLVMRIVYKETGGERWISIKSAPVFNTDGTVRLCVSVSRDITAIKQNELQMMALAAIIEQQRRRLNNVIHNVPGLIWEGHGSPRDGQTFDYINEYSETLFGYSSAELRDDPALWERMIYPEDYPAMWNRSIEIYDQRTTGTTNFRVARKDGRSVHVETYTSVVDTDKGETQVFGVMMDVSARKNAEFALEAYAKNLRRSNEELEQFAYVASHDLQEPLRMVTSYLQLIEDRYKDKLDADGIEFVDYAVGGAARMKNLINDLLMFSRVQRGGADFVRFSLDKALDRALRNLQLVIEDTGAIITRDPLPMLQGSETQMSQLFQNLISNALKFVGTQPPQIHIGFEQQDSVYQIFVRDNGIGIETAYLERIFVIFQRLHAKDKYPGTGIGLSIVKKVVENHGGRIWVESEVGVGTTFYFTLPLL